jgi:hypothetical protein
LRGDQIRDSAPDAGLDLHICIDIYILAAGNLLVWRANDAVDRDAQLFECQCPRRVVGRPAGRSAGGGPGVEL